MAKSECNNINTERLLTWVAWFSLATAMLMPVLAPGENGKLSNPCLGIFRWLSKQK